MLSPVTSATPRASYTLSSSTARDKREEGGDDVKSAWPLSPGPHTRYNGRYNGSPSRKAEPIHAKTGLSSDWGLQPAPMKSELLVTAGQPYSGEYVPGPCTHRPSRHGSWSGLKSARQPSGSACPRPGR